MKLKDLLYKELNEMAAITNADAVIKLIKAGKYNDAVAEMFKEKKLKVVPGNVSIAITKEEKAAFFAVLKQENPSAQRGPGIKAAEKRIDNVVKSGTTSVQSQDVIKKKLMKTLAKANDEVQKDIKLTPEEKEANKLALELFQTALDYSIIKGSGMLTSSNIKNSAKQIQDKVKQEFLKKNAPEVFKRTEEMAKEHKEEIEDYIEARKAYAEKMKKEEGRITTPAKDMDAAFKSGLLKRTSSMPNDDLDKRIGADDETIKKEIEKEDKKALELGSIELDKKLKATSREKQALDTQAEVKRLEARIKEAKTKGRTGKIISDLEEKLEAAKEVAKMAKVSFIKDRWEKRKTTSEE